MAQCFRDQRGKGQDHNPPRSLPAQTSCKGTQGSLPPSWPGPGSWTYPQSSGMPWQDRHPRREPSGPRASKENVFNWLLAGSRAPSTPRKDRDTHTRRSLHRAERQTTKSATRVCACEHKETHTRVLWGMRWEQSPRVECEAWNQAPAFCTCQQEGSQTPHRLSAHLEPWEKAVSGMLAQVRTQSLGDG